MESQELYKLNEVLKSEFPTIYDLIGGVGGLLMCVNNGDFRIMDVCNDRQVMYDHLAKEAYDVLELAAETEGQYTSSFYSDVMLPIELDREFLSWGFSETLLKLTMEYRQILTDNMAPVLRNEKDVTIINIMESPLKGVYYIQFDRV